MHTRLCLQPNSLGPTSVAMAFGGGPERVGSFHKFAIRFAELIGRQEKK